MNAALAVAIAQRPDAGNVGAQLIVHLDVSVRIGFDAGLFQTRDRRYWDAFRSQAEDAKPRISSSLALRSPTLTTISSPCFASRVHSAFRRMSTPSRSRISRIASETSWSSRWISLGPISRIVTSLPNRRNIWPNSRPI